MPIDDHDDFNEWMIIKQFFKSEKFKTFYRWSIFLLFFTLIELLSDFLLYFKEYTALFTIGFLLAGIVLTLLTDIIPDFKKILNAIYGGD